MSEPALLPLLPLGPPEGLAADSGAGGPRRGGWKGGRAWRGICGAGGS